jgi:hypothetical protein
MAFARCPNCEYVQWQLGITDERPAGECPECAWKMDWTLTPLESWDRTAFQERGDMREAAGVREWGARLISTAAAETRSAES